MRALGRRRDQPSHESTQCSFNAAAAISRPGAVRVHRIHLRMHACKREYGRIAGASTQYAVCCVQARAKHNQRAQTPHTYASTHSRLFARLKTAGSLSPQTRPEQRAGRGTLYAQRSSFIYVFFFCFTFTCFSFNFSSFFCSHNTRHTSLLLCARIRCAITQTRCIIFWTSDTPTRCTLCINSLIQDVYNVCR